MMRTAFRAAVLVLTAGVQLAEGQSPVVGQQVRVTAPSLNLQRTVGEVLAADAQSLLLSSAAGEVTVPRSSLVRLEVADGTRSRWKSGMLIGLAAMVGPSLSARSECSGSGDQALCAGYMSVLLAAGAGTGALIGSLFHTTRWVEAAPEPLPSAMALRAGHPSTGQLP